MDALVKLPLIYSMDCTLNDCSFILKSMDQVWDLNLISLLLTVSHVSLLQGCFLLQHFSWQKNSVAFPARVDFYLFLSFLFCCGIFDYVIYHVAFCDILCYSLKFPILVRSLLDLIIHKNVYIGSHP